jgi:hypothetical protein
MFRACVYATCTCFGAVCFVCSVFCCRLLPCPRPPQSQRKCTTFVDTYVCARVPCALETPVFYGVHVLVGARVREVYVRTHVRACVLARARAGPCAHSANPACARVNAGCTLLKP